MLQIKTPGSGVQLCVAGLEWCRFIQTGWTAVSFEEDCCVAPLLFPPLLCPWRRRCGWSGLCGVLCAAGHSVGSKTSSSASPLYSSRSPFHLRMPLLVNSAAGAGSDSLGGLWQISSPDLRRCRCCCSHCLTQVQVRWPLLLPAGQRPAVGTGTALVSSRCNLELQGLHPSLTAGHEPPVNANTPHANMRCLVFMDIRRRPCSSPGLSLSPLLHFFPSLSPLSCLSTPSLSNKG